MSEAHRTDDDAGSGLVRDGDRSDDRDAKIEQLLLVGLDHYFAARYDLAINVWTRALFFDRNHARARAYIERARSAIAERQRQSEEMLQTGVEAFQRGESDEARRLLKAAIEGGAPSDEAFAVLDRLSRLETVVLPAVAGRRGRGVRRRASRTADGTPRSGAGVVAGIAVLALAAIAAAGFAVRARSPQTWTAVMAMVHTVTDAALPPPPSAAAPIARETPLPLPLRGETALASARAFMASGHLRDALAALDSIRPTDAQKPDADRLRADIQRQLLAVAAVPAGAADREKGERRIP
jgi:hypothetical protein